MKKKEKTENVPTTEKKRLKITLYQANNNCFRTM